MKCLAAVGFLLPLCLGGCGSESGQLDVATDGITLDIRVEITESSTLSQVNAVQPITAPE